MNITQKIAQKKDLIIFLLIIIVFSLIGYNVIYKYNLNKIDSIKFQIDEEKKKNEILKTIGRLDERLRAYQKRSFSTTEITPLLDKISELAKKAGIRMETFNPGPAVSRGQYIEIPIGLPFSCGYHKLGQFLSLIESSQEFIWLKKLNMQKPTVTDPKEVRVPKISLELSGFYLKK